jgi:hypothetical protein
MRTLVLLFAIPALLALPARAEAGELKLTIQNGLVTLIADEVPISTILAEWARVGKTRIVNGDQVFTPVTLQIIDTPERKALDILLRSVAGYMVAERPTVLAGASAFDRIMILPTSRAPANIAPLSSPAPVFTPPRPVQAPPVPDMDDEEPVVVPGAPQPGMQPQPGPPGPGMQPAPGGQPQAPLTAPRPGPLPQPPPQQPVPFGSPAKPGGGGGGGGN